MPSRYRKCIEMRQGSAISVSKTSPSSPLTALHIKVKLFILFALQNMPDPAFPSLDRPSNASAVSCHFGKRLGQETEPPPKTVLPEHPGKAFYPKSCRPLPNWKQDCYLDCEKPAEAEAVSGGSGVDCLCAGVLFRALLSAPIPPARSRNSLCIFGINIQGINSLASRLPLASQACNRLAEWRSFGLAFSLSPASPAVAASVTMPRHPAGRRVNNCVHLPSLKSLIHCIQTT
jgi:hypothetical protein